MLSRLKKIPGVVEKSLRLVIVVVEERHLDRPGIRSQRGGTKVQTTKRLATKVLWTEGGQM